MNAKELPAMGSSQVPTGIKDFLLYRLLLWIFNDSMKSLAILRNPTASSKAVLP